MGGSLGLVAGIGGFLLAAVIIFALLRNKQRTVHDVRRTEDATRDLYARTDQQDKVSDPDPKNF